MAQTVKNLPVIQDTWVRSLGWEVTLEKGMATHSSILAWRIPWTEEPGRLQSMGSQRVGHDSATSLSFYIPWASLVAQMLKNLPAMQKTWVQSLGLIPGSGTSPGEGNGNPFQYYCLENSMDSIVHGVTKNWTRLLWPPHAKS